MESQTPPEASQTEFSAGTSVIYAMHGKCQILGTETRSLKGESIRFYKLEMKKSSLSRSHQETAIWVPVIHAKNRGLRTPMSREEAEMAMKILLSKEYFFNTSDAWSVTQPKLEATIRLEGGLGLAKVASFLYVLKKKQVVASLEVTKLQETVYKLLFRELSEALGKHMCVLEEQVNRAFRTKLTREN